MRSPSTRSARTSFVVAPDKETIYPDLLPREVPAARPVSRLDVLAARLRAGGGGGGRPPPGAPAGARRDLLPSPAGRSTDRTDTHWNELGALLAARPVLARARAAGSPACASRRTTRWRSRPVADRGGRPGAHAKGSRTVSARSGSGPGACGLLRLRSTRRAEAHRSRGAAGSRADAWSARARPFAGARPARLDDGGMLPALAPGVRALRLAAHPGARSGAARRGGPDLVIVELVERTLWEGLPQ